jgi:hypothetical protein
MLRRRGICRVLVVRADRVVPSPPTMPFMFLILANPFTPLCQERLLELLELLDQVLDRICHRLQRSIVQPNVHQSIPVLSLQTPMVFLALLPHETNAGPFFEEFRSEVRQVCVDFVRRLPYDALCWSDLRSSRTHGCKPARLCLFIIPAVLKLPHRTLSHVVKVKKKETRPMMPVTREKGAYLVVESMIPILVRELTATGDCRHATAHSVRRERRTACLSPPFCLHGYGAVVHQQD